jgi:hypothetical protein
LTKLALALATLIAIIALAGCPAKKEAPAPAATPVAKVPPVTAPEKSPPESPGEAKAQESEAKAETPPTEEAASNPEAEKAALAAADAWLKLADEGKYEDCWSQASELMKAAAPEADFAKQVGTTRDLLGELVSRKVKSTDYATSLPGAPDGEYVVIQYDASFAKKASAVETITPMKDPDGVWRVSGYYLK